MPSRRTTPSGYEHARRLRKEPSPAESKLWAYLRGNKLRGVNFRRQHALGRYVTDFCSPKVKLIIELDGSQHLDQEENDAKRTEFLQSEGYRVLRFWNSAVMNKIEHVISVIEEELDRSN
jgi:very-short-patch-repair endonuclease